MKNVVSKNLIDLSNLLDKPIYIVGGAVRDFLLGNKMQDIDLAGSILPGDIKNQLEGSKFHVTKASEIQDRVNDAYLKANGQKGGRPRKLVSAG